MFYVEVYSTLIPGVEITRYLQFETYMTAANCVHTFRATEQGIFCPEDFFEVATVYKEQPMGEQIGDRYETDWVITYLEKSINNG